MISSQEELSHKTGKKGRPPDDLSNQK